MSLELAPLLLILAGVAAYVVLGGADFGAGLWHMLLRGERRRDARDHTYHAMGPVWEANHVWLIFVLVITWTAYPGVFGAVFSTLYVPLFIAAVGIILRGATYALRSAATGGRAETVVSVIFGASSLLTPFALATVIGGIASGRVPASGAGDAIDSWLNPTSIAIGVLSVVTSAYLAAVWLTADAARAGRADLVGTFRRLALAAGAVGGAIAVVGLIVVRDDARNIYDGLTSGAGLLAVIGSALAGLATLAAILLGRFEFARYSAAVAVGAIVAGWALAQSPDLLPGLSVDEAAAGDATLVALLIATAVGALILIPSLTLLFGLVLRGAFDPREPGSVEAATAVEEALAPTPGGRAAPSPVLGRAAIACAVLGLPLTVIPDGGAVLAIGVVLLLAAVGLGSAALIPAVAIDDGSEPGR